MKGSHWICNSAVALLDFTCVGDCPLFVLPNGGAQLPSPPHTLHGTQVEKGLLKNPQRKQDTDTGQSGNEMGLRGKQVEFTPGLC